MNGAPAIGDNGGPPIDAAEFDVDVAPSHIVYAHRTLAAICAIMGVSEASPKKERMEVRHIWLRAIRPHLQNKIIAKIANLNRKTVTIYARQIDRLCDPDSERFNGFVSGYLDQIYDMVEPMKALIEDSQDVIVDLILERAVRNAKAAADHVARPIVSAPRRVLRPQAETRDRV